MEPEPACSRSGQSSPLLELAVQADRTAFERLDRVGGQVDKLVGQVGQGPGRGQLLANSWHIGVDRIAPGPPSPVQCASAGPQLGVCLRGRDS